MRIAFFDGILEQHVCDSLERAFVARGHEVYSTGKIGHGFEFARGRAELRRLELAVANVIDFRPDWVLVFRPASLPPHLHDRLARAGIRTAAWFSDDPVLFDLTYGPVVDDYDLVLHCGNERVLRFYEERFGRPTGVNFPFWTDHVAFPRVWGTEPAESDALFLGNVHDEVRRRRYFDLARLESDVTVYGNVGNDYFGIWGGYLDSDAEVVAAGARARTAISVPQYFRHHRGLPTWFPGLDRLGFFEYPSRIVQYMAMGLPVVSVVEEEAEFRSFPEMIVCRSFAEVDDVLRELTSSGALEELSEATGARFRRHFQALSRVLAFESLVEDDDWRRLDARERALWFTRFDATAADAAAARSAADADPVIVAAGEAAAGTAAPAEEAEAEQTALCVGVFGMGWTRASSRLSTTARALARLGHRVVPVNPASLPGSLVPDPQGLSSHAIVVPRIAAALRGVDVLVIAGVDAVLTGSGREAVDELGVRTVLIDDSGKHDARRLDRLARQHDLVAVIDESIAEAAHRRGSENVVAAPHFVDGAFLDALEALDARRARGGEGEADRMRSAVRIASTSAAEEAMAPGFGVDLAVPLSTWSGHASLDVGQLAVALRSRLAFLSFEGTRGAPRIPELLPYAFAAADRVVVSRSAPGTETAFLAPGAVQAREPGETALKLRHLATSRRLAEAVDRGRAELLAGPLSAETTLARLLGLVGERVRGATARYRGSSSDDAGERVVVTADPRDGAIALSRVLDARPSGCAVLALRRAGDVTGRTDRAQLVVRCGGAELARHALAELPPALAVSWRSSKQFGDLRIQIDQAADTALVEGETAAVDLAVEGGSFGTTATGGGTSPQVWARMSASGAGKEAAR